MLTHKIGENSSFDGDMELAESFTKLYYTDNDPILLLELKSYYKSRALNYWRILEEHLLSDQILEENANEEAKDIIESIILERNKERERIYGINMHSLYSHFYGALQQTNKGIETLFQEEYPLPKNFISTTEQYHSKRKYSEEELNNYLLPQQKQKIILQKFTNYENGFMQLIQELDNSDYKNFNQNVIYLFSYIGNLNCLDASGYVLSQRTKNFIGSLQIRRIFPLVNHNGVFSFNTWLYCFFEGVILAGFSSRRSEFDQLKGCSISIFQHDLLHMIRSELFENKKLYNHLRKIYYNILNSNLTKEQKELHILVFWPDVHENNKNIIDYISLSKDKIFLKFIRDGIYSSVGNELQKEFKKYSQITIEPRNIENVINTFETIASKLSDEEGKIFLNVYEELVNNLEKNTIIESDITYMCLGMYYVIDSICDFFSK